MIFCHPMYEAGRFLAEEGREECMASAAGLWQYSTPFPQFWESANEIERLYMAKAGAATQGHDALGERGSSGYEDIWNTLGMAAPSPSMVGGETWDLSGMAAGRGGLHFQNASTTSYHWSHSSSGGIV